MYNVTQFFISDKRPLRTSTSFYGVFLLFAGPFLVVLYWRATRVLKSPRERCRHPGQKQRRGPWYLPSQAGSDPTVPPALSRRFRAESGFTENKSGISSSFVFVVSCLSAVSSLGDRKTSIPAVSVGNKTLSVIYISAFYWVFTVVLYLNHLAFALAKIGFWDRMIFFLLVVCTRIKWAAWRSSFKLFIDVGVFLQVYMWGACC